MRELGPKTIKRAIHGNPEKPDQITGHIKIAIEDGEFDPETVVDSDGNIVPLTKVNPAEKKSSGLHKPADIGIPPWLQGDLD